MSGQNYQSISVTMTHVMGIFWFYALRCQTLAAISEKKYSSFVSLCLVLCEVADTDYFLDIPDS
jgi:hypothetical protein